MSPAKQEEREFKRPALEKYAAESSAYYSTVRLWDDGVIDPADTRTVLGLCIAASLNAPQPPPPRRVQGVTTDGRRRYSARLGFDPANHTHSSICQRRSVPDTSRKRVWQDTQVASMSVRATRMAAASARRVASSSRLA